MTKAMKFYSYKFFLSRVLRYDWFFYFINNFFL